MLSQISSTSSTRSATVSLSIPSSFAVINTDLPYKLRFVVIILPCFQNAVSWLYDNFGNVFYRRQKSMQRMLCARRAMGTRFEILLLGEDEEHLSAVGEAAL